MAKSIHLVVPEPDSDPGDKPVEAVFISPDGADPDREVPGFFIIQIDGEPIWPGDGSKPADHPDLKRMMPRQFLSLDAVHTYLRDQFGWKIPLRVTSYVPTSRQGPRDFPAVWGAGTGRSARSTAKVRARYLGSFAYWNGRRVDPTKVGTARENINN